MATVWIPPLLQDLTGGQKQLTVPGDTVGAVITALEQQYPGVETRLVEDGRMRPGIAVVVNDTVSYRGLRHRLSADCEVHFLPALSGG